MDISIILILPICEHGISFHLFVLSSISFINVLQFSEYRSFTFLVKFILRYFNFFDVIINGIFLISLIVCYSCIEMQQISVYWFCILQLYWIHLLVLTDILVGSLRFSRCSIMLSGNSDSFTSSIPDKILLLISNLILLLANQYDFSPFIVIKTFL